MADSPGGRRFGGLALLLTVAGVSPGCTGGDPLAPVGAARDAGIEPGAAVDAALRSLDTPQAPDESRARDGVGPSVGDGPFDVPFDARSDVAPTSGVCDPCRAWGVPEPGMLQAPGLANISGMAASWKNPGLLFVHNDRNEPRFFAVDEGGHLRGDFRLAGATVSDLEDMAVSRCPAGTCVYLADIGNNISPRSVFVIYRAPEPAIAGTAVAMATLSAERFAFSYADGPHNAESLVIDPGGTVYVITKEAAGVASAAYRLETFETDRTNQAIKVATLPVPASDDQPATAASADPCGHGFLLRTGNRLYQFRSPMGAAFADAFNAAPTAVPAGQERQSEAVTFGPDGRSYYTTGEGVGAALFRVRCAPDL